MLIAWPMCFPVTQTITTTDHWLVHTDGEARTSTHTALLFCWRNSRNCVNGNCINSVEHIQCRGRFKRNFSNLRGDCTNGACDRCDGNLSYLHGGISDTSSFEMLSDMMFGSTSTEIKCDETRAQRALMHRLHR